MNEQRPRLDQNPWARLYERGLERCRSGQWELGLEDLISIYGSVRRSDLPGLFYSYMGFGLARNLGQLDRGLKLCHRAIELEFYQPDNYLNLARTQLLSKNRGGAVQAVEQGLQIDPNHPELLELQQALGARRAAVIPFFSRHNPLNRFLGRLRHDLERKSAPQTPSSVLTELEQAKAARAPRESALAGKPTKEKATGTPR
ncbi:MAG: hypothetical protein HC897_19055 [Thermoanaerobaculia bacterium]|nr:hypothetical protein [Thermoanaerobaculia bacterium]